MKILFSAETLYPPIGGADISLITLLNRLSEDGHEVTAIYMGGYFNSNFKVVPQTMNRYKGNWINSYLNYKKWKRVISKFIEKENPDLVITQELFTPATVDAVPRDVPIIAFVRNNNFANIHGFEFSEPSKDKGFFNKMGWKFKIQYPFFLSIKKRYIASLKRCEVLCVSKFLQKELEKVGIRSEIIRPFIDIKKFKVKEKGDSILYVGPSKAKGLDIFLEIVRKMPGKKFIMVGKKQKNKIPSFKNLEVLEWIKEMKKIYSETKILLVPSIYPDPCPRVVIEAGASGIPSIVSNMGGLPEEVDNAQVVKDLYNIDEWVQKIKMLDDAKTYNALSKNSIKKAEEFEFEKQYKKFLKILNRIMNSSYKEV